MLTSYNPAAPGKLEDDLPGNEKPLTEHHACWYLNERSYCEEIDYGNLIQI